MSEDMQKVFFNPGDTVVVRQDILNRPIMVVKSVDKIKARSDDRPQLFGITCFWFSADGIYQVQRFNTKDLEHNEF